MGQPVRVQFSSPAPFSRTLERSVFTDLFFYALRKDGIAFVIDRLILFNRIEDNLRGAGEDSYCKQIAYPFYVAL